MTDVPVVILAGGQASRMGGGDKFMRALGRGRIIDFVIDRAKQIGSPVLLNANGDATRLQGLGLTVIADIRNNAEGPLAGIHAGLSWAKAHDFDAVLTVAADTPFFPVDLGTKAIAESEDKSNIVIATSPGVDGNIYPQPTFGLWPVKFLDALKNALENDVFKIMRVVRTQPHAFCNFDNPDAFFNINTPCDLENAQLIASQHQ